MGWTYTWEVSFIFSISSNKKTLSWTQTHWGELRDHSAAGEIRLEISTEILWESFLSAVGRYKHSKRCPFLCSELGNRQTHQHRWDSGSIWLCLFGCCFCNEQFVHRNGHCLRRVYYTRRRVQVGQFLKALSSTLLLLLLFQFRKRQNSDWS